MTSKNIRQRPARGKASPAVATVAELLERLHPSYDIAVTRSNDEGGCLVVTVACIPKEGVEGIASCRRVACITLDGASNPVNVLWSYLLPEQDWEEGR